MSKQKNRVRPALEILDERCMPSVVVCNLPAHPLHDGGPQAVRFASRHGTPDIVGRRVDREHVIPIKLIEKCSADISTMEASARGFATHLGRFTATGQLDSVNVNPAADQAEITGRITVVTARGDKLLVSFTTSWQLSTGIGHETITVTGGTGRYAGASGGGTLDCVITADPDSPTTFRCDCTGSGILILPHRP